MVARVFLVFSICIVFLSVFSSCKNNHKESLYGAICDTSDTKFSSVIYPIIVTNCNTQSGCHGGSSLGSISLEGYANVNDNYAGILSRIVSGSMPKLNPKLDNCTILKVQTWINKGHNNN